MTRRNSFALVSLVTAMTVAAGSPGQAQRSPAPTTVNWALHNLDLAGMRYSTLDQINTST